MPCASPTASAPSASSANAGREEHPVREARQHEQQRRRRPGARRTRERPTPPRPWRARSAPGTGCRGGRRSGRRSAPGSTRARLRTSQTPPIAAAPQPASERCSGPSTDRIPNRSAGSVISTRPATKRRLRNAAASAVRDGSSARASSSRSAHAPSTTESPASAPKTTLRPSERGGRADHRPEQRAEHRRADRGAEQLARGVSRGATASSHASAPAHVKPLPTPWTNRAANSVQKLPANAKPRLASPISTSPISTARRGPSRDRGDAAGEPADERARGVRGDEHARAAPSRARTRGRSGAGAASAPRRASCRRHEHRDEQQQAAHSGHATKAHAARLLVPIRAHDAARSASRSSSISLVIGALPLRDAVEDRRPDLAARSRRRRRQANSAVAGTNFQARGPRHCRRGSPSTSTYAGATLAPGAGRRARPRRRDLVLPAVERRHDRRARDGPGRAAQPGSCCEGWVRAGACADDSAACPPLFGSCSWSS